MGWIGKFMGPVIKAIPAAERETMMLKMMPDMIRKTDMVKMMPNMARELGDTITLLFLFEFAAHVIRDEAAREQISTLHGRLMEQMPGMMDMMHPVMMTLMSEMMPRMMGFMSTMMPDMHTMMPEVMENAMLPMIRENPRVKAHMLAMMQTMFPHCAMNILPLIDKEERAVFINQLCEIMAASGTLEMGAPEKQAFGLTLTDTVQKTLNANV